jgi:hypothetical protein
MQNLMHGIVRRFVRKIARVDSPSNSYEFILY